MNYRKLIRTSGDPILKVVCAAVEPGEALPFLETMERACKKAKGVGLAAPQIGIAKRVIMTFGAFGGPIRSRFLINPELIDYSPETAVGLEGCLSYPIVGEKPVERHEWIVVRYLDLTRTSQETRFQGFEARVIQHELDHLDGVCKVGDPAYHVGTPKLPRRNAMLPAMAVMALAASMGGRR